MRARNLFRGFRKRYQPLSTEVKPEYAWNLVDGMPMGQQLEGFAAARRQCKCTPDARGGTPTHAQLPGQRHALAVGAA